MTQSSSIDENAVKAMLELTKPSHNGNWFAGEGGRRIMPGSVQCSIIPASAGVWPEVLQLPTLRINQPWSNRLVLTYATRVRCETPRRVL